MYIIKPLPTHSNTHSPAYLWRAGSACWPWMPPTSEGPVWCSQSHPASWGHACARHLQSTASSVHLAYSGEAFYRITGSPWPVQRAAHTHHVRKRWKFTLDDTSISFTVFAAPQLCFLLCIIIFFKCVSSRGEDDKQTFCRRLKPELSG